MEDISRGFLGLGGPGGVLLWQKWLAEGYIDGHVSQSHVRRCPDQIRHKDCPMVPCKHWQLVMARLCHPGVVKPKGLRKVSRGGV